MKPFPRTSSTDSLLRCFRSCAGPTVLDQTGCTDVLRCLEKSIEKSNHSGEEQGFSASLRLAGLVQCSVLGCLGLPGS